MASIIQFLKSFAEQVRVTELERFNQIWFVDIETAQEIGECPQPKGLVAYELRSGKLLKSTAPAKMHRPPWSEDSLVVVYQATKVIHSFRALGWDGSANLIDLQVEHRVRTNGRLEVEHDLPDAVNWYASADVEWDGEQMSRSHVAATKCVLSQRVEWMRALWERIQPTLELQNALYRGRYLAAVARMEACGVPIDTEMLGRLRANWCGMRSQLIREVDREYEVYLGDQFVAERFRVWLYERSIPWPQGSQGTLKLDDETFRQMAKMFPSVAPLRELRHALSSLRIEKLAVGRDGRNRTDLRPFRSKTGRNQPSTNQFIFGPAVWLRGLIKPEPGTALAYIDWSQQEWAIAAALSGDSAMRQAYESGDPYLTLAKQAGVAPASATKTSHADLRNQFKQVALAVQYGMQEHSLAQRLGIQIAEARELLRLHRKTYPTFWEWSESQVNHALLTLRMESRLGWRLHVSEEANTRSLANFPMQANGAEMLRIACIFATEAGIRIGAPVHDALLLEAPIDEIDDKVIEAQACMARAARHLLDGFELKTDPKIVRFPERYMDEKRGRQMWDCATTLACGAADTPITLGTNRRQPDGTPSAA